MRTHIWTAMVLVALVVASLLLTFSRTSARDVTIPCEPHREVSTDQPDEPINRCALRSQEQTKVPTMIVNTRKIRLNYSVSDVGPSGVSAIELWATRDGHTWQRYSHEPPPAGPLVVHVAEEGRYGFAIVVQSGAGRKSPAPQTGDAPQLWVEVDETKPVVKIKDVHVGTGRDEGMLYINYTASDVRLTPRPVSISMASKKDGPWTTIASGLENTGIYGWEMPREMPYQFYIRVEAEDQAGNIGSYCISEPITIDLSRPRGTILGVDHEQKPVKQQPKPIDGFFIGIDR